MHFSKTVLLSAAALLLPLLGNAASVASDPTLSIGNLTFSDFSCSVSHQGVAGPGGCGSINVNSVNAPANGVQFSSGFMAASLGHLAFEDATINYHVTSATGINSVALDFNGMFYGFAVSSVTETFKDEWGTVISTATVACGPDALHIGCSRSAAYPLWATFKDLYITTDINVSSFIGMSSISYIGQSFGTVATPEPSSFAMFGAGLIGVVGLLRRRSKAGSKA